MKKLVVLVVAVLLSVAGWAGATYVIGVKAEGEYNNYIEKYARLGPVTMSSRSYERGFLSATAETVLELTIPKAPAEAGDKPEFETLQLVFVHDIYHGPLPIAAVHGSFSPALALIDTRIVSSSGAELDIDQFLQQVPELKNSFAHTRIGFDGSAKGQLEVPTFAKQDEEGRFTFGGLTATSKYNRGAGTLVGRVDMPSMDISFPTGSVRWQGIHYDFDLIEALPMLYVGSVNMTLGGMEMETVNKGSSKATSVVAQEIRVASETNFADGMVYGNQTMVFDGVNVDGATYGPMELDIEMKNLDGQALSDYQQNILTLYGDMNQLDPQAMFAKIMPVYSDLALRLMAGSPEFNVNRFYVNTPMGEANGTIKVKYDHPQQEAPAELANLVQYIPFFDADANLRVDQGLAKGFLKGNVKKQIKASMQVAREQGNQQVKEMSDLELEALVNQQIEMQLQMFAAQGFITRDGEKIQSHITFSGGQLQVNGKPMSIFGQQ